MVVLFSYFKILAQDTTKTHFSDSTDFSNLSIDELMKLKSTYQSSEMEKLINQSIEVASRKPLSAKKSPSVVSVITAEEIEKSGARDLVDILQMVPGIDFNMDVQGSIGISIRGIWAQEGKVLLLLDGQEMNEIAFASLQFNQGYPISQIKKIEVIRGPGSASYGGYAEYAVINIITKNGEDIKGVNASSTIGQTANTYARQNINLSIGQKMNDFSYSLSGYLNHGQRSNLNYTDVYGSTYSMVGNSTLNALNINFGVQYKGLSFRYIQDNLYTTERDQFDKILSKAYKQNFLTSLCEIKYQKQMSKNFQFQSKVNYKHGLPWNNPVALDSIDGGEPYKITTDRYRGNVAGIWDIHRSINLAFGLEAYYDIASKKDNQIFAKDSVHTLYYLNYAPYVQSLIKTRFANITAGIRYDVNSAFGSALNPRIGITKKIASLNIKALYASSFRAPAIENIQSSLGSAIKPEKSQTFELEVGYQINRSSYFSINTFDITTKNSIHYFIYADSNSIVSKEGYDNISKSIGTQGLEIEYKFKSPSGSITSSYSFYTTANKNVDEATEVPANKNVNLGIANHKLSLFGTINLNKAFFITSSIFVLGKRYGYSSVDSLGNGIITAYNPQLQLNLFVGYKNAKNSFSIGFGIRNITNQTILYIQPYNSYHNALPGMGREFNLKMAYYFNYKK